MIHRFNTIDSTNTYAKKLAAEGAPQGTVIVANCQTGGRGRMGRNFFSPADTGLYMSMVLRPNCDTAKLMHLTCAVAVAACDAIETCTGLRPGIKWINDIVYQGKKLGGILTELGFNGTALDYAVVGIGINCNHSQKDFPSELQPMAASLSMVTGNPIDREKLETALINSLAKMADTLQTDKDVMLERYRANCITLGQDICVVQADTLRHAKALDVDQDGRLLIQLPDGTIEAVSSGEASVRGMYGYL